MLAFPLLDQMPAEFDGILYNFWWDLDKLHSLDLPQSTVLVAELLWQLDLHWWQGDDEPFQITPRQVIRKPDKYPIHYQRTLASDLSYPVIVRKVHDRLVIIDGVHRLLKAVIEKRHQIEVTIMSDDLLPLIFHEED